jgi:uncharacterized protein with HEPN domain
MQERVLSRLDDILDAIDQIDILLEYKTFDDIVVDRFVRAAFERFLEILSEASRHIPDDLKSHAHTIAWSRIAGIGNHLRHAYHRVDAEIIWRIYEDGELVRLHEAATEIKKFALRAD